VRSLAGIEQCFGLRDVSLPELDSAGVERLTGLPKLETLAVDAAPNGTDWSPLLRIPSLRRVKAPVDAAVAERLVERGVDVRTRHRPLPLERLCAYASLRRIADRVLDLPAAERDRWALARCGDDTPDRLENAEELVVARAWLMLGDPGAATEQAYTKALLHLATRLDDAGQGHEAAAATEKAVELLRRHDTDLPELGAALELLADRLRPHRAEQGIAALTEASAIFHRLALADPDRYADRFLATNGRLALDREGGVAAGVDAARQRVELLRALGATDPSYAVLIRLLDDLSGQESGADATRLEAEAAAVQRELATAQPTFFTLRDLARRYRRLGQREDALAAAEQALAAARRPTGDDPTNEHRHLAWALQDVVGRLTDLGRHAEALTVAEEQVAHGERGVAEGIASESALVQALHRYGACCNALDRLDESVAVQQRIVDITRRLAETDSWQRLVLAALLTNLGNQLSALGRLREALEATAEGVERFRELGDDSKLAIAVSNLGIRYGAVGRNEESAVAAAEAVEVARRLAATDPSANEPGLVTALNNLAISLNRLGRHAEAVTAAGEAVDTARRRTDNETDLARPLNTLGWSLSQAGEHAAGLTASIEAVAIYRRHAQGDDPLLADALTDHAAIRSRLGRHAEALAATDEAVALYRRLAADRPGKFGADLARCLSTFAEVRLAAWPELSEPSAAAALAAADEAVSRFEALAEHLPDAHEAELRAARSVQAGIHRA
jgi:tetratricopeptide (TPR) repeat protein